MKFDLNCERCQKLYARVERIDGRQSIKVLAEEGLKVRPVDLRRREGVLKCTCGHETPIDLIMFGVLSADGVGK
jgi:hypothetical protein